MISNKTEIERLNMAPANNIQRRMAIISAVKLLLTLVATTLQLHLLLFCQLLVQYQALRQEAYQSVEDKNRAVGRYRQLRNRFVRKRKRHWKNPGRTEKWWTNILDGAMLPEEWLMNFRMSRDDFMNLEEKLRPFIKPCQNSFRGDTISSFKKLAMTLYYLKDQGSLRMTSNTFGVGHSTVSHSIRQVSHAVVTVLGPQLIQFPTTTEGLNEVMARFESKFGFPMVVGCVDGTHIPIKQPNENAHDYFCYKLKYSLSVQAVCDENGLFLDVDCSWPGSVHDAKVFANSKVNKLFQENKLPNVETKLNNADDDCMVGPVLIGDPAYPLLPGLLKEYDSCKSDAEVIFNTKLRAVRNQIECAFGRLKARWRILNRPMDLGIEFIPTIIYCCFVLHNHCESKKAPLNQDAVRQECEDARIRQNCSHHLENDKLYSYNSSIGKMVREKFKNYFDCSSDSE